MRECSSLQSLRISSTRVPSNSIYGLDGETTGFTLDTLGTIVHSSIPLLGYLMRSMRCPQLRVLELEGESFHVKDGDRNLQELVETMPELSQLYDVTLGLRVSDTALIEALPFLSAVRRLHLKTTRKDRRIGRRVVNALHQKLPLAKGGWLCPMLETLVFSESTKVTEDALETLIRERIRDGLVSIASSAPVGAWSSKRLATVKWGEKHMVL